MADQKKVLIADDDVAIVEFLKEALSDLPLVLDIVHNGADALTKTKENSYDLLLLDVMMPRVDGYHVASEVSATMGEKAPKILIMTSRDTHREGNFAAMTGAVGMIQKPFRIQDLRDKITQLLGI